MSIFLSACFFSPKPQEDPSLPRLDSLNVLADVSSVGFEWKLIQDENIKGFVVYRAQSGSGAGLQKIATIKNRFATHFYDINLQPQTKYIYAFATLGENNTISPKSELIHIQTSFIDPVESVFAINNQPRSIKLIYSPHPNPSIDSYLIQRLNKAGEFKTIKTIPHRLSVEYFDEKLKDGETYTYRIIAQSHEGIKSKPSQIVSVSTIPQPAPIEDIQATTDLPKAIKITWQEAPDTQGVSKKYYRISYSEDGKNYKNLATTNQTHYIHKLEDKKNGISYYYQVVLLGDNGLQGHLSSHPAKGSSLPPPSTPNHFNGSMQEGKAVLSWQTPSDDRILSYVVYRKEGGLWTQSARFVDIYDTQFIDKEMQEGKSYTYSVVSVDKNGIESAPTPEITLQKEKP
ncbi:fibronectin type III domain-containing protein [Helicobacter marmotae]|uniref:hypothetical protein n=1 Tax=Helicobacter marmotae TaxID=152490 RepID=UPI001F199040|nr:hypothetical protein [Helicobacter marmotae]